MRQSTYLLPSKPYMGNQSLLHSLALLPALPYTCLRASSSTNSKALLSAY